MNIYLDIETIPDQNISPLLRRLLLSDIKADGRLSDPEKIEKDILKKIAEKERRFSLHPLTAQIICVTIRSEGETRVFFDPEKERELLADVNNFIKSKYHHEDEAALQFPRLVTFNGKAFDIPILTARLAKYGMFLMCPFDLLQRYDTDIHRDLRQICMFNNSFKEGTFQEWCAFFDIPYNSEYEGSEIFDLFLEKKWTDIVAKCWADVEALEQLERYIAEFILAEGTNGT